MNSVQVIPASNLLGTTTLPPETRGASRLATIPWMWKRTWIRYPRSSVPMSYEAATLRALHARLAWDSGTAFGVPVVPDVCSIKHIVSGVGAGTGSSPLPPSSSVFVPLPVPSSAWGTPLTLRDSDPPPSPSLMTISSEHTGMPSCRAATIPGNDSFALGSSTTKTPALVSLR